MNFQRMLHVLRKGGQSAFDDGFSTISNNSEVTSALVAHTACHYITVYQYLF